MVLHRPAAAGVVRHLVSTAKAALLSRVHNGGVSAEHDDPDYQLDLAKRRLDIVEQCLRAIEMMDQIGPVVRSSEDSASAARALMDVPFGFSQFGAHYVMDMTVSAQTVERRNRLSHEANELRSFIEEGTPLSATTRPDSPASVRFVPLSPPQRFLRYVVGPDDEIPFAGGTVRVVGIEVYESIMAVQWRHVRDTELEALRSFGSAPQVSDDIGNEYPGALQPDSVPRGDELFGRLICFGVPAEGANELRVEWGNKTIAVALCPPVAEEVP